MQVHWAQVVARHDLQGVDPEVTNGVPMSVWWQVG